MNIIPFNVRSEGKGAPAEPPSGWYGLLGFIFPFAASAIAMAYLVYWLVT